MKKLKQKACVALFSILVTSPAKSNTFSTDTLFEAWLTDQCVEYCFVGICVFLRSSAFPPSCTIVTTPRVEHYWPDFLVTVQNRPSENPYNEFRMAMEAVENEALSAQSSIISAVLSSRNPGSTGAGSLAVPDTNRDKITNFKEANVIGNPVLIMSDAMSEYTCPTRVRPFTPYYSSAFDAFAWRTGISDIFTLDAWTPGRREIGSMTPTNPFGNTWGAVQPRQGFTAQGNDIKASAVVAQRAVDIVLAGGGGHLYVSPRSGGGSFNPFNPGSQDSFAENVGINFRNQIGSANPGSDANIAPNHGNVNQPVGSNEKTARWQMVSPRKDNICRAFGADNQWFNTGITDVMRYNNNRQSERQQYAYNYWQKYACCWPSGGRHLTTISIPRVCLTFGSGGSGGSGDDSGGSSGSGDGSTGSGVGSQVVAGSAAVGAVGLVSAGSASSTDQKYDDSIDDMERERGELHERIEYLETQIIVNNQKRDALHAEYTQHYNNLPGLQSQQTQLQNEIADLTRRINNANRQLSDLDEQISNTDDEAELEELNQQRNSLVGFINNLQTNRSRLNGQLANINQQISHAESRLNAIPGEIRQTDAKIVELETERQGLPY
ncbi:hypothetical protein THIAE_06080 [Thiomicrospira aerophila AL3]|uniref:Integrating conjugative element protein n=1 Tax=Thiomicrospira aerophila AL3 TaxID=717772 RepID=W0DYF4_9GAMM|nr:TraU family protein [Thiomicrospira aerophila]AHF02288.1 hypothetical protein THIAE_06080 [Thiomicrospira aerophila AL3]